MSFRWYVNSREGDFEEESVIHLGYFYRMAFRDATALWRLQSATDDAETAACAFELDLGEQVRSQHATERDHRSGLLGT